VPVCAPRWREHLHSIAVQFQTPVFVTDNITKWRLAAARGH